MALIVEDGSGRADAESFVSVAGADDYLSKRNRDGTWATYTTSQKEGYLRAASEYLDAVCRWRGMPMRLVQALGWPRAGAMDRNGLLVASDIVPPLVIAATCEIAALGAIEQEGTPTVSSKTVGPITVEYDTAKDRSIGRARYRLALDLVSSLATNGVGIVAVVRS